MTNRPFQGPPAYDLLRSQRATETNRLNEAIEADWPVQWRQAHSELSVLKREAAVRRIRAEYLKSNAFHEAAHVVIWKELTGLDIVHASIEPVFTDDTVGHVKLPVGDPLGLAIAIHWENSGVRRGDLFRKAMRAAALFALAGLEAENAFFHSRPCHIDSADFQDAWEALHAILEVPFSFATLVDQLAADEEIARFSEAFETVSKYRRIAARLVRKHQDVIERVASALAKLHYLSADDVALLWETPSVAQTRIEVPSGIVREPKRSNRNRGWIPCERCHGIGCYACDGKGGVIVAADPDRAVTMLE